MSFRVLSGTERVLLGGNVEMMPYVRYVLPAGPAQTYANELRRRGMDCTMSVFNSYARPYGGTDLNGRKLAFYRHSAFGDQLMATAVPVYLKHLFPQAQIDVYCTREVMDLWRGLPVRIYAAPLNFEAVKAYDFHLFYDQMLEEDREPDQGNAYDNLFGFAGHSDVPDLFKRPKVVPLPGDFTEFAEIVVSLDRTEKYLVYQLGAANTNRTYPPEQGGMFIREFCSAFPDWRVVLVGLDKEDHQQRLLAALGPRCELSGRVVNRIGRLKNFRSLIPLVANASLVVCPDSSIGHLAAAFPKVPVISLWGLFAPADRVKYYANHHPLWPREVCPFAPCHNHEFELPEKLCASASNATAAPQKWCNVLRAVSPDMILRKAEEILIPKP